MPKFVRISDGVEVEPDRGWIITGTGNDTVRHPYRGLLNAWSDEELIAIGLRRVPDPPAPPPPPPPTPRERVEQAAKNSLLFAIVDLLAEDRGVDRSAMLDLLASKVQP